MWKSIAVWPPEVKCGNANNESSDTHRTEEQARAVCRGLQRDGYGGAGKIFPISTRVEEVK